MFYKWRIFILAICATLTSLAQKSVIRKSIEAESTPGKSFIVQKNNLYGLGDSGKWHTNSPTGDTIFHLGDSHFAVRTGQHYSIYNETFQIIAQRIKIIKQFGQYVFLHDSAGCNFFSKNNDSKKEYLDSVHVNERYAILFKKGRQGIIYRESQSEKIILPLYDKVGPYYEGVLIIDKGKLGWKGSVDIPTEFDHIYKEREDIMIAKNSRGSVYYSLESQEKLLSGPKDSVVFYDQLYKTISGSRQSIFYVNSNQLFGESNVYQIHPYSFNRFRGNHNYCVAVKDSSCALFKDGKILSGFDYDNFLEEANVHPPYFKVVKDKNVGVINERGEFQLKTLYTDIADKRGDYYIIRKGNLLGICTKGDSVILPPKYLSVTFAEGNYVYLSLDGKLFGLFDYVKNRSLTSLSYHSFELDSVFIIAKRGELSDVYFKEELKFSALYDAESNGTTVKGYKDGKVFMGFVRNGAWEEYNYEIPSYKVVSNKNYGDFSLRSNALPDVENLYDYSVGKWGVYSLYSHKWNDKPLAHSGDNANGVWLLGFYKDTAITWNGINFHSGKSLSPIDIAWQKKSRFAWMDVQQHRYSSHEGHNSVTVVSPICYSLPGKGRSSARYKPEVNFVFEGRYGNAILAENGKVEIANHGEISLSDFISRLGTNGNVHPSTIADYEKIIDPEKFIKISGATEHILQVTSAKRYISFFTSFDWLSKKQFSPFIVRSNGKYGLLSDSGDYMLRTEYESMEPMRTSAGMILKVGVKAPGYKLYDPKSKTLSKLIPQLMDSKGELLLVKLDSLTQAVLNTNLDTLAKSEGAITLIGGKDFCVSASEKKNVYRDEKILFSFTGSAIEKINNSYFIVSNNGEYLILDSRGETLFKSNRSIKYLSLGDHYLLDDGADKTLFGVNDKVIYKFEKLAYLANENQDLVIKEENSVTVFEKNKTKKISLPGKLVKATKHFIVLNAGKFKTVYSYSGEVVLAKAKQVKEINDEYLAYSEGKNYFLLNTNSKEKKKIKSLNVNLSKEGIEYEDLDETPQILAFKESDSLTVSEHNGKYGLSIAGKTVLPHKYFTVEKFNDKYLVQDQVEYKLYNYFTRKFISDVPFENVQPYKDYLMVTKKGKIRYLDIGGKVLE